MQFKMYFKGCTDCYISDLLIVDGAHGSVAVEHLIDHVAKIIFPVQKLIG
jgi:hypothetical protein